MLGTAKISAKQESLHQLRQHKHLETYQLNGALEKLGSEKKQLSEGGGEEGARAGRGSPTNTRRSSIGREENWVLKLTECGDGWLDSPHRFPDCLTTRTPLSMGTVTLIAQGIRSCQELQGRDTRNTQLPGATRSRHKEYAAARSYKVETQGIRSCQELQGRDTRNTQLPGATRSRHKEYAAARSYKVETQGIRSCQELQ
ncbi:hypothetical protein BaRGS_00030358, partial [Batillaria attramentaria]